jgi:hypothetical protein
MHAVRSCSGTEREAVWRREICRPRSALLFPKGSASCSSSSPTGSLDVTRRPGRPPRRRLDCRPRLTAPARASRVARRRRRPLLGCASRAARHPRRAPSACSVSRFLCSRPAGERRRCHHRAASPSSMRRPFRPWSCRAHATLSASHPDAAPHGRAGVGRSRPAHRPRRRRRRDPRLASDGDPLAPASRN